MKQNKISERDGELGETIFIVHPSPATKTSNENTSLMQIQEHILWKSQYAN